MTESSWHRVRHGSFRASATAPETRHETPEAVRKEETTLLGHQAPLKEAVERQEVSQRLARTLAMERSPVKMRTACVTSPLAPLLNPPPRIACRKYARCAHGLEDE